MPQAPFSPRGIDHLVLRVHDMPLMLDFYCQVLGCHIEKVQETIGLWQLRCGSALIDLQQLEPAEAASPALQTRHISHNLDHFCINISPFDASAVACWLTQHQVTPGIIAPRYGAGGEGPSIYLQDPEGNHIELKGS